MALINSNPNPLQPPMAIPPPPNPDDDTVTMLCGHQHHFHKECLRRWTDQRFRQKKDADCPICRAVYAIRPFRSGDEEEEEERQVRPYMCSREWDRAWRIVAHLMGVFCLGWIAVQDITVCSLRFAAAVLLMVGVKVRWSVMVLTAIGAQFSVMALGYMHLLDGSVKFEDMLLTWYWWSYTWDFIAMIVFTRVLVTLRAP